jgi:hypothetical protein
MTTLLLRLSIVLVLAFSVASPLAAQEGAPGAAPPAVPSSVMTFFVTSEPIGNGGNLGGLAGADAHCQKLAAAVGAGHRTWRAYLSTQARPGQPAVDARDRIGDGPWYYPKEQVPNAAGRGGLRRPLVKSQIHGDTLLEAQRGSNMSKEFALTEKGERINGIGDPMPTRHDILTGSTPEGRAFPAGEDRTCNNWTSGGDGAAQVGHSDRIGWGNQSWNSSHASTGCSQHDLVSSGGVGLFYCFAID